MRAIDIFRKHKDEVTRLWTESVFKTYPLETTGFLRTKQDPFGNPVGHMTKEAAAALYDAVIGESVDIEDTRKALDRFIKLRAVQKFTPSQGLGVFSLMKPLLRTHVLPELLIKKKLHDYLEAESRLDSLTLLAFDMYVKDREILAESRITEIRNQYAQLARWAQRLNAASPLAVEDQGAEAEMHSTEGQGSV
ncbi:MAG: RsbRD N-terminal domain-containing protein [Desulfovibrio sp.]|nr:RsbRD N-terminal domain-containing protein [Desulfovibrio sp.]